MSWLTNQIDFATDLGELVSDQAEWSQKVFGPDNVRGPAGPLKHMVKEIEGEILNLVAFEAIHLDAVNTKRELLEIEFADLLILFLDAIRRADFKLHTIVKAAIAKMEENKKREWPPFDPTKVNEAVEHIRETKS